MDFDPNIRQSRYSWSSGTIENSLDHTTLDEIKFTTMVSRCRYGHNTRNQVGKILNGVLGKHKDLGFVTAHFSNRGYSEMVRWLYALVLATTFSGCSDLPLELKPSSTNEHVAPKNELRNTIKNSQDARLELQERIDRYFGGQPLDDLFDGSIAIWREGKKIQRMEVVRVVQKYNKDGDIVPNKFVAVINCATLGSSFNGNEKVQDFVADDFTYDDDVWQKPFFVSSRN